MQITKDAVASIQYSLKNASGELLDQSAPGDPMPYLHGAQNIIPGLESELEGKGAGDKVQAVIPPEAAYGVRNDQLVMEVPRTQLPEGELKVGMQFQVQHSGGVGVVTLTKLGLETVTMDGNHPLAGVTLHFHIDVVDVREATSEELDHGHVHGPGGHQH